MSKQKFDLNSFLSDVEPADKDDLSKNWRFVMLDEYRSAYRRQLAGSPEQRSKALQDATVWAAYRYKISVTEAESILRTAAWSQLS